MFTLWYTVLSYKEYKNLAAEKSSNKLPISKPEPSKITPAQPSPPTPSHIPQPIMKPTLPTPQPSVPVPQPKSPQILIPPERNLSPKVEPPRSPSPQVPNPRVPSPKPPSSHPIKNEDDFNDDEYDNEDEDEHSSESDQEDQDSVLVTPAKRQGNNVNEFLNREQRHQ